MYVNQGRKQKMYKTSIYFKVPQSRDGNIALGTGVPLIIKVREEKFKNLQENASWQICIDETNGLPKSPPESWL